MIRILLALVLLCACVSTRVDTLKTDGAIGRQIDRVLTRHDVYVEADLSLAPLEADAALAQSDGVRSLAMLGEVRRFALRNALWPVSGRHDDYVRADLGLDELERETYLASSEQLRRLLGSSSE